MEESTKSPSASLSHTANDRPIDPKWIFRDASWFFHQDHLPNPESVMNRSSGKNSVVILKKDGVVRSFFTLDPDLLDLIEKTERAKKSSIFSKCVSGLQKTLGI